MHLLPERGKQIKQEKKIAIRPEWILAIIRQETAGVVRPRFEQHILTRLNRKSPDTSLEELRFRSMSLGLGQIMGMNYKRVGAASAKSLYTGSLLDQVLFVGRFLSVKGDVLTTSKPGDREFRKIARFYNGPGYEKHYYHEGLARWFREFSHLLST